MPPRKLRKVAEEKIDFNDQGEQIYCICRRVDDGSPMVCCSGCGIWYHCDCVGLSKRQADNLEHYTCKSCNEAWDLRRLTKTNLRNQGQEVSDDTSSEFEGNEQMLPPPTKKPKAQPKKSRRPPTPPPMDAFPDDTDNQVRNAVRKGFSQGIEPLFKKSPEKVAEYLGKVTTPSQDPLKLLAKPFRQYYPDKTHQLASLLESHLFWSPNFHQYERDAFEYQPTNAYKTQYRSLRVNLCDLSHTLLAKVLTGMIPPSQLAILSPQDMVRDDVKKVMEEVKIKSLKETLKVNSELENTKAKTPEHVIETITEITPISPISPMSTPIFSRPPPNRVRTPSPVPSDHSDSGLDWLKDNDTIPPPRTPSGSPPPLNIPESVPVDPRGLVTQPPPISNEPPIWQGTLHLPNVGPSILIQLRQMGGRIMGDKTWDAQEIFPQQDFALEGRLKAPTAHEYLSQKLYSSTKEILVFEISSSDSALITLCQDLDGRDRVGAIGVKIFPQNLVQDFYIVPLVSKAPGILKKLTTRGWLTNWKPSQGIKCLGIMVVTRPKPGSIIETSTPTNVTPPVTTKVEISDDVLASLFSAVQSVQPGVQPSVQPAQPFWNPDLVGALSNLGIPPPQ